MKWCSQGKIKQERQQQTQLYALLRYCVLPAHHRLHPERRCFFVSFSSADMRESEPLVCACACARPSYLHSAPWKPQFIFWCWSVQDPLLSRGRDAPRALTRKKLTVRRKWPSREYSTSLDILKGTVSRLDKLFALVCEWVRRCIFVVGCHQLLLLWNSNFLTSGVIFIPCYECAFENKH